MKNIVLSSLLLFTSYIVNADVRPKNNLPAIHQAIIEGDLNSVKQFVKNGGDINQLDPKMGNTPLHIAAQTDHSNIVRYLIQEGAFVNIQAPRSGFSPLMIAVWYSRPENIKELFKAKDLNINLKTPQGLTAEQWIGGWDQELDKNEIQLINSIKDLFSEYKRGQMKTLKSQKLINVLLDRSKSEKEKTAAVKKLIAQGENVNQIQPVIGNGNDTHTPLLIAARSGYTEIVKELLSAGADQTMPGHLMNAVAFHKAAYKGHPEILKLLVNAKGAKKVINDVGPNNGYTPLHDAIWHGNTEAAKVLIDAGARTDLKTYEGDTPLELARRYKYSEIVRYLE